MNIKGFIDRRKNLKLKQLRNRNYHFKLLQKDYEEKVTNLENSKPFVLQTTVRWQVNDRRSCKKLLKSTGVTSKQSINYEIKQHGNQIYVYPRPYYSDTFNFTDTGTVEATIVMQDSKLQEVKKNITFHIQDAPFYENMRLFLSLSFLSLYYY